jgi:hypothetical protein
MSHRWPYIDMGHRPTAPTTGRIRNVGPASSLAPPPPGRAVLACRCGVMLDLDDMHRPARRPDRNRSGVRIEPICCARCAYAARSALQISYQR